MSLDELTFFELHVMIYNSSVKEASEALSIDHKVCKKFIKSRFNLTATELKKIHPKKAAALLGEWCHQPIKSNYRQIRQKIIDNLPSLLLTEEYLTGKEISTQSVKRDHYPGIIIAEHSLDYISGYEEGYTINLLNSSKSYQEKGQKLGVLAKRLKKQSLEEMDFIQYSRDSQIRDNPEFLSGFEQGLKNKKKKINHSLYSEPYKQGKKHGQGCFKKRSCAGKNIGKHTPCYLNGYEEGYTISLLNSEEPLRLKGIKLGVLAERLGKKELEELQFIANSGKSQILHEPEFLNGFKEGLNFASLPDRISKKMLDALMNKHPENVSSPASSGQENYSPVFTPRQESPATLVQCSSPAHSNLENDNTGDNFSSLETSNTSYTALTPNSTVTTNTFPSLRQENDNDLTHSDGGMALPVHPFQQTEKRSTVPDNPSYQKNNDYGIQVANNTPSPQLNNQEREENPLNQPTLPASKTPQNNASSVVATQSPVTRPYSINNSIPWEKSSLNSANANKTRSGQTRAAFVAENPCHFFQNPWASLPSSSLNPLAYAQGQTRKRKLTP
ncbi:hypothetical protein [Legionella fairfieldensis]|uniref:hypothetical protein n=1 Tax=Legionella fairfieldensis TaxID=45064 RepID=UPI00048ED341|nr:hypothetical protein [Legionella fairfieldensis]